MARISRRRFLLGAAASAVVAAGGVAYAETGDSGPSRPTGGRRTGVTAAGPGAKTSPPGVGSVGPELPTAAWVTAENARPGTLGWLVTTAPAPHAIEGYADRVSARAGDTVTLYVNTIDPTFHVEAYRMGWYQGLGGRLVWQSAEVPGQAQPAPLFTAGINMIECHWAPSLRLGVTSDWPPGNYLLKLVGSGGHQQYVPITVRDDNSTAAVALMNAVTTWQAYNLWHGYSLYYGVQGHGQAYSTRSRVVSFDRPYALADADWANGASDWMGNEFPFLMLAERWGLDLAYLTDIDLASDWTRLLQHKLLVSMGHDEYWSKTMYDGALLARDEGVNFAFLGANACFRHIRLDASPTGPDRHVICYKDAAEDPLTGSDPADSTADWPSGPVRRPESMLIGNMYQSNPVDAALVCADPTAWGLAGTGMAAGDSLPHVVGSEYDAFDLSVPGPRNLEIWCHSPLVCRGVPGHSDVTYYSAPYAGGVFATGSNWWVNKLADGTGQIPSGLMPAAIPGVTGTLTQITRNVLTMLGSQPGGLLVPSTPNWSSFYSPSSGSAPQAVPGA
jgi:hypothetical protein